MKTFKQWCEGLGQPDNAMKNPQLMAAANQAQGAMKQAITKGLDPVKAAQQAIANNAGRIPIKDIGKIMPTNDEESDAAPKMMKKKMTKK